MKKLVSLIVLTVVLSLAFTGVVFATRGGMPEAHGVPGRDFGAAVSGLAQEDPAALVEHVTGCCPEVEMETETETMGLPGAHGLTGAEFGAAVSALAQMDPGALADHVSGNAQGKPAAHGVDGRTFGGLVSAKAKTDPAWLVAHITGACFLMEDTATMRNSANVTPPMPGPNPPGDDSIAEIAIGAGFSELVAALSYVDAELDAGLVDLFLSGTDQYTVFAPTNKAFENLYVALGIDEITDLPADLVLDVLLYHVAEGRRAANSVVPPVKDRVITTLLGATFTVNSAGVITDIAGQSVNIVASNISASNGIIHVIDAVLLPLD
jgi:uncharacterized surface protein with fasciclin (FAS1) repeats